MVERKRTKHYANWKKNHHLRDWVDRYMEREEEE